MPGMDRYRKQSAQRDAAKRPSSENLQKDLEQDAGERIKMNRKRRKLCTECGHSTAFIHWQTGRGYYMCRKGHIVFPEDIGVEQ